jgi:TonB family protein
MVILAIVAWQGGQEQQSQPAGATVQRARTGQPRLGKLLEAPKPEMPPLAAIAHIQGRVEIEAVIDKDGTIAELHVRSGHPFLIPAAMEAAKQYRYQPTMLNGEPVQIFTTIEIDFKTETEPSRPIPARD